MIRINKKTLAALTTSFTLAASSLTGCGNNSKDFLNLKKIQNTYSDTDMKASNSERCRLINNKIEERLCELSINPELKDIKCTLSDGSTKTFEEVIALELSNVDCKSDKDTFDASNIALLAKAIINKKITDNYDVGLDNLEVSEAPSYERFYNYVLCASDGGNKFRFKSLDNTFKKVLEKIATSTGEGINSNSVNSTEEVLDLLDSMIKLSNEEINYASYKGYNDDIFDYELGFIGKQNKFTY